MCLSNLEEETFCRSRKGRSVARCPESYDKIIAIVNKTRIRDQEEKNKIFTIY